MTGATALRLFATYHMKIRAWGVMVHCQLCRAEALPVIRQMDCLSCLACMLPHVFHVASVEHTSLGATGQMNDESL